MEEVQCTCVNREEGSELNTSACMEGSNGRKTLTFRLFFFIIIIKTIIVWEENFLYWLFPFPEMSLQYDQEYSLIQFIKQFISQQQ